MWPECAACEVVWLVSGFLGCAAQAVFGSAIRSSVCAGLHGPTLTFIPIEMCWGAVLVCERPYLPMWVDGCLGDGPHGSSSGSRMVGDSWTGAL